MIPSSVFTVVIFFMFVAPGLLYDLVVSRTQVGRRESTFVEISRVVLASTVFSAIAIAIIVALGNWLQDAFIDVTALVRGGNDFAVDHLLELTASSSMFLLVALAGAWLTAKYLHRNDPATISYISAWKKVIRDECPPGSVPSVRLHLKNGTTWMGTVRHYSPDTEHADREIVLCPPIAIKPKGKELQKVDSMWQRVIIKGSDIDTVSVRYITSTVTQGDVNS